MSGHGTNALLAGGYYRFRTGLQYLVHLLFGDFTGQFGIDHFQVSPAAAAQAVLPIRFQLDECHTGKRANDVPGCIIYMAGPAQITGVMVSYRHGDFF